MTSEASQAFDETGDGWLSVHLYYHETLDRALRGFVLPMVVSLARPGEIEAFFFVRYVLGGPHVRLRLRARSGDRERLLRKVERSARDFLAAAPSTKPWAEEAIRRANDFILSADPHETDDAVYPDNSFRVTPFRPEIDRYGGPDRFRASLDFFMLSSVAALDFLVCQGEAPRSAQLVHAFRLLLAQALGFAADETELADLLRYGVDSMGGEMPKIVEKGDRVAQAQKGDFLILFEECVASVRSLETGSAPDRGVLGLLVEGSGRLSAVIEPGDREARAWIGGSQLHMTASRLGLSNVEEVYVSRLLTVTLAEVRAGAGESLSWLGRRGSQGTVAELLPPSLEILAGLTDRPSG